VNLRIADDQVGEDDPPMGILGGGRALVVALGVAAVVAAMGVTASPADAVAKAARPYDFDGNSYPDLVIGAPAMRVGSVRRAGGVVVLPSSKKGPSLREKVVTQSSRGIPGASERDDRFGAALASADFNRDGFADLAVGQPGETVGEQAEAGLVTVIYGSRNGLNTRRSVTISRPGGAQEGARWGQSLAAADFDGNGFADLAVGAPSQWDGLVGILPGGPGGLSSMPKTVLTRQPESAPENDDGDYWFGAGLATGDLDGDHDTDLVVMSEGLRVEGDFYPLSVTACLEQSGRLGSCRRLLHEDGGLTAIAVGNMSGDALPEIVVGSVGWDDDGPGAGAATILHLQTAGGLSLASRTELDVDSPGVPGSDEDGGDAFGDSLALGDIDRDGWADLVVGAPGYNQERGRVTVVHGGRSGWRTTGNYTFTQNTKGIPGKAERGDWFGGSLTLLDHNRDGRLDLTIGAPGENKDSGMITTLPGSGKKFSTSRSRTFGLSKLHYRHPTKAEFGTTLGR
jgi:hypothetical protein